MADIIIIVPTEREALFFEAAGLRATICGAGPAECAATTAHLIADKRPDLMILAGIAGACTDDLAAGETVAVSSETIADLGRRNADGSFTPLFQKTYRATCIPEGFPPVSGNTVNTAGGCRGTGPAAIENMEGAAFFAVCERFGVPAMEVRTISNRVGDPVTAEKLDHAARCLADDLKKIVDRTR